MTTRILALILALIILSGIACAEEDDVMRILVSDGTYEVVFELNDTQAAVDLYNQLPLGATVENYSSNEKIFYPDRPLDGKNAIETGGQAGGLAYFSPWGNVVMYYGAFGRYPGLYVLGEAISGAEYISLLSGEITVSAYEAQTAYKVRISFNDRELIATFADNATARALIDMMPMTLKMMDLYDREMCYRFTGTDIPAEEAQLGSFDFGKILYWTPWHSFVIVYAQSDEQIDNLQYVGAIDSGAELLGGRGDIEVMFELIEKTN